MYSLHDPEPLRAGKATAYVETLTPHLYIPTAQRPVRAKCRWLEADTQVKPHRHPWGQLAISTTGTIRLTVAQGTYIVPPSRVLWVPPGMEHAVTMVESADLRLDYTFSPALLADLASSRGRRVEVEMPQDDDLSGFAGEGNADEDAFTDPHGIDYTSSPESPDTAQTEKVTISPSGMARSFR